MGMGMFIIEQRRNVKKMKQLLPTSISSIYSEDEFELLTFIYTACDNINTAIRVADQFKLNKVAPWKGK
jgi:hypothetical protein